MADEVSADEVAEQLVAAFAARDLAGLRALYHDDAEIWHNTDRRVQRPADNTPTVTWLFHNLPDARYVDIRRSLTADGYVQQHVLVATNRAGRRVEVEACLVVKVTDGRITRLDEYLDSAAAAALSER